MEYENDEIYTRCISCQSSVKPQAIPALACDNCAPLRVEFDFKTTHFYGEVFEADDGAQGWFEHHDLGDEYGGGLWFEWRGDKAYLTDYDGIADYLPGEVITALELEGFNMDYGKDPEGNK